MNGMSKEYRLLRFSFYINLFKYTCLGSLVGEIKIMECTSNLTIDSFREEDYVRLMDKIYVHKSIDLKKKIYHYLSSEYLLLILETNKFRFSNRNHFTDLSENGKKYDPHKCFRLSYSSPDKDEREINLKRENELSKKIESSYNICVSCWTYDTHFVEKLDKQVEEDFLMWKAYTWGITGVRIETTIDDFLNSIKEYPCDIVIRNVEYKRESFTNNVEESIFTKTIYYDKEQELRICALCSSSELFLDIDVSKMIKNVMISPFVSKTYADFIIKSLETKFVILKGKISKSRLLEYKK